MYHIIDPSYVGSYQLVSELVDPNQRFQQHAQYQRGYQQYYPTSDSYQQPLASPTFVPQLASTSAKQSLKHEFVPWQLPYPEVDLYQQQYFAQYQQYVFRSEFVKSSGASAKKTKSNTYGITATDLDSLKNRVKQMLLITERIQGNLENMNRLLSENTKMHTDFFLAARSSNLQSSGVVAYPKSIERPANFTTPELRQSQSTKQIYQQPLPAVPLAVLTPSIRLENPSVPAKVLERSIINVSALEKVCSPFSQMMLVAPNKLSPLGIIASAKKYASSSAFFANSQWILSQFFGILSESSAYEVFDLMLKRITEKIFDKKVFIFDPGGSLFDVGSISEVLFTYGNFQMVVNDFKRSDLAGKEDVVAAGAMSRRYWNYSVAHYNERISDGFYDIYELSISSANNIKMPSLSELHTRIRDLGFEVIVVNIAIDNTLVELEQVAQCIALVHSSGSEIYYLGKDLNAGAKYSNNAKYRWPAEHMKTSVLELALGKKKPTEAHSSISNHCNMDSYLCSWFLRSSLVACIWVRSWGQDRFQGDRNVRYQNRHVQLYMCICVHLGLHHFIGYSSHLSLLHWLDDVLELQCVIIALAELAII